MPAVPASVERALAAVRPHPHRGDLIAAAAVPLAVGVLMTEVRFASVWGRGVLFVLALLATALVLGMGLLAPLEEVRPRAYQTVLLVAGGHAGTGWELVLLAVGLALVAYAGVDREPGPGYLGFVVLALFVAIAGPPSISGASLIGWPILLLILGGAGVAAGLRPRRDLPPEPAPPVPPPPPRPMSGPAAEAPTEVRPADERDDPSEST